MRSGPDLRTSISKNPLLFKKREFLVFAGIIIFISGIFVCPIPASAYTVIQNPITQDVEWTKENGPYVIYNNIAIGSGVTLQIDPGAIVKFANGTYLIIYGSIKTLGTEAEPVYLTSIKDDSVGGDTNGDGNLSSPYHEFGGIYFYNSALSSQLLYTNINYSAGGLYFNHLTTTTTISHVNFSNVTTAISSIYSNLDIDTITVGQTGHNALWLNGGVIKIKDSELQIGNFFRDSISINYGANVSMENVTIRNLQYGNALSINDSNVTISSSTFSGGSGGGIKLIDSSQTGIPSLTINNSVIENYKNNNVTISGGTADIEKTVIRSNNMGIDVADSYSVASVKVSESVIGGNVKYGINNGSTGAVSAANNFWGHSSGPKNLTTNPSGLGDLVSDNVVFTPWLTENPMIEKKIEPVIVIPGILGSAQKDGVWVIDPIFHTYDDLIATLAANGYEKGKTLFGFPYDWRYSNVLTAVELRDKIKEVKNICQCSKVDLVAHSIGGLVARQYIESDYYNGDVDQLIFLGTPHLGAPKAYLPWEGAYMPVDVFDQGIKTILTWDAYKLGLSLFEYIHQDVLSIGQLLPTYNYLSLKSNNVTESYPNGYPQNSFLESLNDNVDKLYDSGVKITNIVGNNGAGTISSFTVASSTVSGLWEHGQPSSTDVIEGDGTVPESSAGYVNKDLVTFNSEHTNLPGDSEELIYAKLTNKIAQNPVHNGTHIDYLILIKMLSPADIQVVSPDGKRVGKDFTTGKEINEIPGAFYSGFQTDDEYVTIPNPSDGEYKVVTQGTGGGGGYTVATGYVSDSGSSESDFKGHTLPGMINTIDVNVSSTDPNPITITPEDNVPPVITINSPTAKDYLRSEDFVIDATSTDVGSGVFSFDLALDGIATTSGQKVDLFFQKLSEHSLVATSSDYVGNVSTSTVNFRIISTASSLISDIERCYNLGWIDNQGIENSLLAKIKDSKKNGNFLKALLNDINAQRGKHINEQAYQLLAEDINWLLNN